MRRWLLLLVVLASLPGAAAQDAPLVEESAEPIEPQAIAAGAPPTEAVGEAGALGFFVGLGALLGGVVALGRYQRHRRSRQ